jgi:hypothetical protein
MGFAGVDLGDRTGRGVGFKEKGREEGRRNNRDE